MPSLSSRYSALRYLLEINFLTRSDVEEGLDGTTVRIISVISRVYTFERHTFRHDEPHDLRVPDAPEKNT